jgi:tripartite ATP-independent transporter DctP family solute receptor
MRKRLFFLAAVTLLAILPSCQRPQTEAFDYEQVSPNDKIIIRFSHVVGEDTPKGQAARLFAKLMKERTQGKVEVQIFSNGSLYTDVEELEALQKGEVQIIAPALSKASLLVPELGAFDLPYLYPKLEDYHKVLDGNVGSLLKQSVEKRGMVALAFWDSGFKHFTTNSKPIQLPEDLKGSVMRTMPSAVLDQQFILLQATPVEMNFNDVYLALEQQKIHGQENSISNIYTKRFYKVQKYMSLTEHGYLGYIVLMKQDFWNGLPPQIQKVIQETMKEVTDWERQQAVKIEETQLREIEKCECIKITRLTDAEKSYWKQFFQPLYQVMERRLGSGFLQELKQHR